MCADQIKPDGEHDRRLAEAIDGYIEGLNRGETIPVETWVSRFPDIAGELRNVFPHSD